jgi:hypothetical protein
MLLQNDCLTVSFKENDDAEVETAHVIVHGVTASLLLLPARNDKEYHSIVIACVKNRNRPAVYSPIETARFISFDETCFIRKEFSDFLDSVVSAVVGKEVAVS